MLIVVCVGVVIKYPAGGMEVERGVADASFDLGLEPRLKTAETTYVCDLPVGFVEADVVDSTIIVDILGANSCLSDFGDCGFSVMG